MNQTSLPKDGCYRHPERSPVAACVECGKPLCDACVHSVRGKHYCGEHAPAHIVKPTQTVVQKAKESGKLRPLLLIIAIIPTILFAAGAFLMPDDLSSVLGDYSSGVTGMELQQISVALDAYKVDVGRYPTEEEGLPVLCIEPMDSTNWLGPYLPVEFYVAERGGIVDMSGNVIEYYLEGDKYTLVAAGTDGEIGTKDDIALKGPIQ